MRYLPTMIILRPRDDLNLRKWEEGGLPYACDLLHCTVFSGLCRSTYALYFIL